MTDHSPGCPPSFAELTNKSIPAHDDTALPAVDSGHMNTAGKLSATRTTKPVTFLQSLALVGTALLFGAACSATAPSKLAPASAQTHATMPAQAQAHIILYNINSDGPYYRAVVTGTIGDYGPAIAVYPNGKVDPQHNRQMALKLQQGSFRLNIAEVERTFFTHVERTPPTTATCSHYVSFATTIPIVTGSGTGAYRGITGSFKTTVTANEVQSKPCTPSITKPPLWEVIILTGSGTVTK